MTLKAIVKNGGLTFDEPIALPDGTVVAVQFLETKSDGSSDDEQPDHDDMDPEEIEQLHASLDRGLAQMQAGQGRPFEEFLAELRQRG